MSVKHKLTRENKWRPSGFVGGVTQAAEWEREIMNQLCKTHMPARKIM